MLSEGAHAGHKKSNSYATFKNCGVFEPYKSEVRKRREGLRVHPSLFALRRFSSLSDALAKARLCSRFLTAIKVAEAVLIPVYGQKLVESERPFKATLKNGIWTVGGTLYCGDGKPQSTHAPTCVGGVAVVKISKKDGCVLFMTHYK